MVAILSGNEFQSPDSEFNLLLSWGRITFVTVFSGVDSIGCSSSYPKTDGSARPYT